MLRRITIRVERTVRGRHVACLRKRRAGTLRACPYGPMPSGRAHSTLERYTDKTKIKNKMRNEDGAAV